MSSQKSLADAVKASGDKSLINTTLYKFPISDRGSIFFAVTGCQVMKAELIVYGHTIATIEPKYDASWTPTTITELDFLGNVPFHNHFISHGDEIKTGVHFTVDIDTAEDRFPSIMLNLEQRAQRNMPVVGYFMEPVCIMGKKYTIVYAPGICGLKPPAAKVTDVEKLD